MTRLGEVQGKALVHLISTMRRDWQPAGIEAAIRKAAEGTDGLEVCVAAVRAAADPAAKTPGLIAAPGPHWQGLSAGSRLAPIPCPFHDDQPASRCARCRAEAVPPPPDWRNRTTEEQA